MTEPAINEILELTLKFKVEEATHNCWGCWGENPSTRRCDLLMDKFGMCFKNCRKDERRIIYRLIPKYEQEIKVDESIKERGIVIIGSNQMSAEQVEKFEMLKDFIIDRPDNAMLLKCDHLKNADPAVPEKVKGHVRPYKYHR
jgi:hypothetical protein